MNKVTLMALAALLTTTACAGKLDRLESISEAPPMRSVSDPTTMKGYQPISWPMPTETAPPTKYANSLWQQGSRTFFRDQRAARVGDILKVVVSIKDKSKVENKTDRTQAGSEAAGLTSLFGLEKIVPQSKGPNASNLLGVKSQSTTNGDGKIERKEEVETQFAATVVQVLANGNLVIDGRQEIRVNNEIREISVAGVVRPEDIASNNTIDYSQIAEARISYGGRGQISEIQGPRWGKEVVEVLSPF
jgi:flagellar L-ring protein FlgH